MEKSYKHYNCQFIIILFLLYLPTIDPELPPRTEIATPTPLGTAIAKPTTKQLHPVLLAISVVGQLLLVVMANMLRVLLNLVTKTHPKMKPQMIQISRQQNSLATPILTSFLFLTAVPNTMARIGPINGDTSILATSTTLEFSTSPKYKIKSDIGDGFMIMIVQMKSFKCYQHINN